jgi:hypothetical protein
LSFFPRSISDPYAGSASDNDIFIAEWPRLCQFLPRGSVVFLDKGYLLAELLHLAAERQIRFEIPPRKHTNVDQFEVHNAAATAGVANVRIVVENFISQAVLHFPFVKAPHTVVEDDLAASATRVSFFLCNYFPPLTSGGTVSVKSRKKKEGQVAAMPEVDDELPPPAPANANVTCWEPDVFDVSDDDDN